MSALGQKQTCAAHKVMSAIPPKADICSAKAYVRFVPKADIAPPLLDHLTLTPIAGHDVRCAERRLRENAPLKFWSVLRISEVVRNKSGSLSFSALAG